MNQISELIEAYLGGENWAVTEDIRALLANSECEILESSNGPVSSSLRYAEARRMSTQARNVRLPGVDELIATLANTESDKLVQQFAISSDDVLCQAYFLKDTRRHLGHFFHYRVAGQKSFRETARDGVPPERRASSGSSE